jgi:deoxyribodipyrimidine photolyase-related protein
MHKAKAYLILSALRHRAAELGARGTFLQVETYGEGLDRLDQRTRDEMEVIDPTSYAARRFVRGQNLHILPSRGFVSSEEEFAAWAKTRDGKRLLMEDFYRDVGERTGILMDGPQPAGGHLNYDHDNRQ